MSILKTKRSKGLALVVALAVLVVSGIGAAYMWFFNQNDNVVGSGNAAKIDLVDCNATVNFEKVLPGQEVDFGSSALRYDGNRYAILRVTLTDGNTASLKGDPTGHKDWKPEWLGVDYEVVNGQYVYTNKRLNEIMELSANTNGTGGIQFYTVDNIHYYALVGEGDTTKNIVSDVKAKFTGEFGGHYKIKGGVVPTGTGVYTPSRQFEQESEFEGVGLSAAVVQCTAEAVEDVWFQEDLDAIMNSGLGAVISSTPDAQDSWNYVG